MNKKTILLIDDDAGIRNMLSIVLNRAGYDVQAEPDDTFMNTGDSTFPDLYLIDRQLGEINGLDICTRLKASALTNKIPVLMLSASTDIDILSVEAGADGFIEKPFSIDYLLHKVAKAVE